VATVGMIEAKPGATNVIAGEAHASLDLRHRTDKVRATAVETIVRLAEQIAARRGLTARHELKASQPAVAMDARLVDEIAEAIRRTGCEPHRMVSGAGHDAMILAEKFPAAMMFVRSPGGVSHSPAETVLVEDVAKAIEAGAGLLDALASRAISSARGSD